jgi:hypothetical protein
LENKGRVPDLDVIENQLRENFDAYKEFMELFVSCVNVRDHFKKMSTLPISKFVTVTDEAFTLLILRNNYAVWNEQADRKKNQGGRDLRIDECENKQIYFTDKGGRGRTWTNEGKRYYNNMCEKIKKDREKNGPTFDAKFLDYILNKFKVDANEEEELE